LVAGATLIGVPLVLLDSGTPANAASNGEIIAAISNRSHAASQLESVFRSHHFSIKVEQEPSAPSRVGSILAVKENPGKVGDHAVIREIPGLCVDGARGCIDAIALPLHYSGTAQVFVGRSARPGEAIWFKAHRPLDALLHGGVPDKTLASPARDLGHKVTED
jgi:hypothetical protein